MTAYGIIGFALVFEWVISFLTWRVGVVVSGGAPPPAGESFVESLVYYAQILTFSTGDDIWFIGLIFWVINALVLFVGARFLRGDVG